MVSDANGVRSGHEIEPTVSASLEHLVAGSQGMITKRVDLAMLEGEQLLSRVTERAAWLAAATILGSGAWFAAAHSVVLMVAPDANPAMHMAAFALLNAGGAFGIAVLASRHGQRPAWTPARACASLPRGAASRGGDEK